MAQQHRGGIDRAARGVIAAAATALWLATPPPAGGQTIQSMDTLIGVRDVPDLATFGQVAVAADEIIDVVILGDGYTCTNPASPATCEDDEFFADARQWYDLVLEDVPATGIFPYTEFSEAFRVRAVFTTSADHASPDRTSYYRTKIECPASPTERCWVPADSWPGGAGTDDTHFRDRVFDALDSVDAAGPLRRVAYPQQLENAGMAGNYSHLVVVMLVRGYRYSTKTDPGHLGGLTATIAASSGSPPPKVRIAIGRGWEHEFGHAFAYLSDEYIHENFRGTTATGTNPTPAERSVFNVSNLTYSNERCDLLWAHIAPGGRYNPNPYSLVGNLFMGGGKNERGVWHSEYVCLINGGHGNYHCNVGDCDLTTTPACDPTLRDHQHFCIWCEEIVALRILERVKQLQDPGDPPDINDQGRAWFSRWQSAGRARYYSLFSVARRIEERDACYGTFNGRPCPPEYPDCALACEVPNGVPTPLCLQGCGIREVGNALYVNSAAALPGSGSRGSPFPSIPEALKNGGELCSPPLLIIVQPGAYPGALTLGQPATVIADGCSTVSLGD